MDPPYANSAIGDVIIRLAKSGLVYKGSVVIVTHSPRLTLNEKYDSLNIIKEHRHGDSCISIYKMEDEACRILPLSIPEVLTQ